MKKLILIVMLLAPGILSAQTNPLWHEQKIKNYLPHMTWPEVQDAHADGHGDHSGRVARAARAAHAHRHRFSERTGTLKADRAEDRRSDVAGSGARAIKPESQT